MALFLPKQTMDFMNKRSLAAIFSLIILACSAFFVWQRGINYGIDFLGGIKLTYHISDTETLVVDGDITAILEGVSIYAQAQHFGVPEDQRFLIKLKTPEGDPLALVTLITSTLTSKIKGTILLEGQEAVGPRVGRELRVRGQKTVIFVLLALLLYIGFRFDFLFAPGAIIALIHDVIITVGVLALLGIEFNLTILAALLTIAGYSINDTIIIYDRIREHSKEIGISSLASVINKSLTETLPRTIVTSITTFLAVFILFWIAGGDIHDFALTFMIGIIVGTYSSIFVASPIYMRAYQQWPPK